MKIPFDQLHGLSRRAEFSLATHEGRVLRGDPPFADTTGFHVYSDLDLPLKVAAGDASAAALLLQILQRYADAAVSIRGATGMVILEVQGGRIHLYREAPVASAEAVEDVIEGCSTLFALANETVGEIAGETPFNIRMAADYGRAIMLRSTGGDESESLISLGNPANRPAKRLARNVGDTGVPAGYLAVNRNAFDGIQDRERWELIKLATLDELNEQLFRKQDVLTNSLHRQLTVNSLALSAKTFEPNPGNPVSHPMRREGLMLRADLDGFSAEVKLAMEAGDTAILALVRKFHSVMQLPCLFKETLPDGVKVVLFPWAGDCANLFMECENYPLERLSLPSSAAINWHKPPSHSSHETELLKNVRWVVALAGGDEDEGHGAIVTGNVYADNRTFHVGAGWSWRRSLDAEQVSGTRSGETVIQVEDYNALESSYQDAYRTHLESPSLFKVASLSSLEKTMRNELESAKLSVPATLPFLNITLPKPRPYAK